MKRHTFPPRSDWRERVAEHGFTYHSDGVPGDGSYWDESVAYEFTAAEVDELEAAAEELHARCLDAVDYVSGRPDVMTRMGIPERYHSYIRRSWERQDPTLYGRFDLAYDGTSPPKMLEYNADTPTLVIETALVQWFWLQDTMEGADQFNSLHEKLLERFQRIADRMPVPQRFYLAGYANMEEERQTCVYLQDLAMQAGLETAFIDLPKIGWDGEEFVDEQYRAIKSWFKLYPWEWMMTDEFGEHTLLDSSGIVEPVWKCLLSNKGILPVLHQMFPDHPNILRAAWTPEELGLDAYVSKPMLGREGSNVEMWENGRISTSTHGTYHGDNIFQEKARLFNQDGHNAVLGCWMVDDKAAGMIIRDSDRAIVQGTSRIVPHWFP